MEWFTEAVDGGSVAEEDSDVDWFVEESKSVEDVVVESFLRKHLSCLNLGSFEFPCDPNFKRSDLSSENDGVSVVDDMTLRWGVDVYGA